MCLGCPITKKRWLSFESMFIPIEIRTWILQMAIREVSLMKPKHQYHLSQRGERVYDAQSWKERRLLCESMFIPSERRASILKIGNKSSFSYEIKASISLILIEKNVFMMPNHEMKRDYYMNPYLSQLKDLLHF